MTGRITRSKSAMKLPAEAGTDIASDAELGNSSREIVLQSDCALLNLPTEIRLQICSYITLSPVSHESVANRGTLSTCRQLQQDMFTEHGPAKDLDAYIRAPERAWVDSPCSHSTVILGPPLQFTRFIRNVTLHFPMPIILDRLMNIRRRVSLLSGRRDSDCNCYSVLEQLYSLYLDRLQIFLEAAPRRRTGRPSVREATSAQDNDSPPPREDDSPRPEDGSSQRTEDIDDKEMEAIVPDYTVKSLHPTLFDDYVKAGKVNCRCVTFTVPALARAKGGRAKSTTLDMFDVAVGIPYTMTIVQDRQERQVERGFASENRFKPDLLLGNTN